MAKTAFATGDALTKKLWEEKLYRDTRKESYFDRFMGESENNIVQRNTSLKKSQGDAVTFGIAMRLTGSGVTSGQTLEGNEEKLTTYNHKPVLEQYRHAVRDNGALDRQRAMFSIDEISKARLLDWGAEKIDKLLFTAVEASPTKAFYGGTATTTATLTASDTLTPKLLSKTKAWAATGGNRAQTPLRPVKVDGKNYFVCLVHNDVAYDLSLDSTFLQARREAEVRGKENPIFSGAYMIWDGVVVHTHENCSIATTYGAGSDVNGALCTFMGAQALVWRRGKTALVAGDFGRVRLRQRARIRLESSPASKPVFNRSTTVLSRLRRSDEIADARKGK